MYILIYTHMHVPTSTLVYMHGAETPSLCIFKKLDDKLCSTKINYGLDTPPPPRPCFLSSATATATVPEAYVPIETSYGSYYTFGSNDDSVPGPKPCIFYLESRTDSKESGLMLYWATVLCNGTQPHNVSTCSYRSSVSRKLHSMHNASFISISNSLLIIT